MNNMINEELLIELIDLGERLSEDRLYEVVIDEIEREEFDSVAKAKALEEAEGDKDKARAFYIKHRVRRIRDLIAEEKIAKEAERIRAEEAKLKAKQEKLDAEKRAARLMKEEEQAAIREENKKFFRQVGIFIYALAGLSFLSLLFL